MKYNPFKGNPFNSAVTILKSVRISGALSHFQTIILFALACLVVITFTQNVTVQYFLMAVVGLTLLVLLVLSSILTFTAPHLLRSEKHVEQMKALEVAEKLGDQDFTIEGSNNLSPENNPALPSPKDSEITAPKNPEESHE